MAEITGGKLLARALRAEGIECLFGLPSPEADPLLAELEDNGIRLVPVHHEAAAVHMAEGLYKTSGKVAAVLGNPGPGSANLLPGVLTARHEGVPVVVITSQHRMGVVYPSSPATFQGQDQLDLFRPVVKWGGPVFAWDRIPEVLRLAFREMWNGRPGPVHLEIPGPVLYEVGEEESVPILPPVASRGEGPRASAEQLDEAAGILAGAERPIVMAGTGVDRARANDPLLEVVELLACPVLPTMAGRSVVSSEHPNYLFGNGPAGDDARREADVVLIVGSRVGNLDLPYDEYWGDPSVQQVIQIDIDPLSLGVSRPLRLGILSDARAALEGLAERLRKMELPRSDAADLARYRAKHQQTMESLAAPILEWKGPGIHPAHAIGVIGSVFGPGAIYTVDGGNTSLWAASVLPPTGPNSYHSILELGMLGTGIPSAVGAKLGEPDREVVCITGDGAAGFNIMEMQSAARERLEITTVVFSEGSWTMEVRNEINAYGRTFGTEQGEIRWDLLAEGLGCQGEFVERIEDLEPVLHNCREQAGPSLVCLRTDREANLAVPEDLAGRFRAVYSGSEDAERVANT